MVDVSDLNQLADALDEMALDVDSIDRIGGQTAGDAEQLHAAAVALREADKDRRKLAAIREAMPIGARDVVEAIITCTVPEGWSLFLDAEAEERLDPLYYLGVNVPGRGGWMLGCPTFDGHWIIGRTLYDTAQDLVDACVARETRIAGDDT